MRTKKLLAPNPGPFTGPGTNTYILESENECLIVDPGPVIGEHKRAIMAAISDLVPRAVLVTHTHPDHAPLANPLARDLGVPAIGYDSGPAFDPDRIVTDGDHLAWGRSELRVLHTPGHSQDHLCFEADGILFTGDHIMGGSTVVVEDMADYLSSLERLQNERVTRIFPGHGEEIDDPQATIADYLSHRMEREAQIKTAVDRGASTVGDVVEEVYADVDPGLHPLAAQSVSAHLVKLDEEGVLRYEAPAAGSHLWAARVSVREQP